MGSVITVGMMSAGAKLGVGGGAGGGRTGGGRTSGTTGCTMIPGIGMDGGGGVIRAGGTT